MEVQAKDNIMRDQMTKLFDQVGYTKETHPALIAANSISSLESLVIYTLGELLELIAQHENLLIASEQAHQKLAPPKSWWLEFTDFIVMLKIIDEKTGHQFSMSEANFSVNGQFRGNFDSLKEQTINLGEGNVARNFELLLTELMSLVKHLGVDLQGDLYARLINAKLFLNREARFFKLEPKMTEAEIIAKNNHVFQALRLLRNFLLEATGEEMTLQIWITDFFAAEILDWRHSQAALARLSEKINSFKLKIKDELAWSLTANPKEDPFLQMKMMIAGAKKISGGKESDKATLQASSSNATLGTTVFWT